MLNLSLWEIFNPCWAKVMTNLHSKVQKVEMLEKEFRTKRSVKSERDSFGTTHYVKTDQ